MHKSSLSILALPLVLALAACNGNSEPDVLDGRSPDPLAQQKANAAPVVLPPAITARATFRCGDNSLVFVDFFQGDELVNFRAEQDAPPTQLRAETAGEPFTNGDITVAGTPQQVTVERGGSTLTCRA